MKRKKKYLIVIVGPTAIGKTSLSIKVAKHLGCEILSADSRQFFKEMEIGTAKPCEVEQAGVVHHFVNHISVQETYNVGRFEKDAIAKLTELYEKQDLAILVGGSGLYVDAVCNGIDEIPKDDAIRNQLTLELEDKGIEILQEELKQKDPQHYQKMNIKNPQRLIRALEVCRLTGKTYTSYRKNTRKQRPFEIIKIGLNAEREIVYANINKRVEIMMQMGLLAEVKSLQKYRSINALNTVGYKELFSYLDNELPLEEAVELIKKNTRNFAKRQLTWFRRDAQTKWFDISETDEIIPFINSQLV